MRCFIPLCCTLEMSRLRSILDVLDEGESLYVTHTDAVSSGRENQQRLAKSCRSDLADLHRRCQLLINECSTVRAVGVYLPEGLNEKYGNLERRNTERGQWRDSRPPSPIARPQSVDVSLND